MPISLRAARPADAAMIAAYHRRCWLTAFKPLVNRPDLVESFDPSGNVDRFRGWLVESSAFTVVVADDGSGPIAHAAVSGNELVHLFVDPDHAGRGLGRQLLAVAETMLAEQGHRDVTLTTMVGNTPAISLYEGAGWTVTDELVHNDRDGLTFDEHVLVKRLAAAE